MASVVHMITYALGAFSAIGFALIAVVAVNAWRREHGHACWLCGKNPCPSTLGGRCE